MSSAVASSSSTLSTAVASSSTVATSSSAVSSAAASSSTSSSAPTPTVSGWLYQGCMTDSVGARVLTSKTTSTGTMSYQSCASFCAGYTYFGVEYSSECYCGLSFTNTPSTAPESDCSYTCSGNSSQVCGGASRMNLFKATTASTGPTNPAITGHKYLGCYTDTVGTRTLNAAYTWSSSMTNQMCSNFCAGYSYFGTEYGTECYCSNQLDNPSTAVAASECSFVCAGSDAEWCGAGGRLSLYGPA